MEPLGGDDVPGEATLTVEKSMADDNGVVYLIGYHGSGYDTNNKLDSAARKAAKNFGADATYVIKVVFPGRTGQKGPSRPLLR